MNKQIQQELALIDQDHPGYLQRFQEIMHEGRVYGRSFIDDDTGCGCFYGWLSGLDNEKADTIRDSMRVKLGIPLSRGMTPIEDLIFFVDVDETPTQNSRLHILNQEIKEYLSQKEAAHT